MPKPAPAASRRAHEAEAGFQRFHDVPGDFAICGGDLVYDAAAVSSTRANSLFSLYKQTSAAIPYPVHYMIGNHDIFGVLNKTASFRQVQPIEHYSLALFTVRSQCAAILISAHFLEALLRVSKFTLLLSAALILVPHPSLKAEMFGFSTVGAGGGFAGSGVLTATNNGNGSYSISAISGTGVTGLLATNTFFTNDNLLFPGASRLVDVAGFSFSTVTAGQSYMVNIFSNLTGYEALVLDANGDLTDTPVTFTLSTNVSATPEPSTLALLGSGLMGIAGTAWCKRRA